MILAIDPGTTDSAYVVWDSATQTIGQRGFVPNETMLDMLHHFVLSAQGCAIEMVACYGMPVGKETFDTVLWVGQFYRQWELSYKSKPALIYRMAVKMHLCHSARAKDGNVRQAIIDRLGPPGTKLAPGKTYGISKHLWSALAVAITAADAEMGTT